MTPRPTWLIGCALAVAAAHPGAASGPPVIVAPTLTFSGGTPSETPRIVADTLEFDGGTEPSGPVYRDLEPGYPPPDEADRIMPNEWPAGDDMDLVINVDVSLTGVHPDVQAVRVSCSLHDTDRAAGDWMVGGGGAIYAMPEDERALYQRRWRVPLWLGDDAEAVLAAADEHWCGISLYKVMNAPLNPVNADEAAPDVEAHRLHVGAPHSYSIRRKPFQPDRVAPVSATRAESYIGEVVFVAAPIPEPAPTAGTRIIALDTLVFDGVAPRSMADAATGSKKDAPSPQPAADPARKKGGGE